MMSHPKHMPFIPIDTETMRQSIHPLQMNDPVLVKHVDFVTLQFLENYPLLLMML